MAAPKYAAINSTEYSASMLTDNRMINKPQNGATLRCDPVGGTAHPSSVPVEIQSEKPTRPSTKALPTRISSVHETAQVVKWGIHWLVPAKMLALLVAGIALAIGHHYYYHSLAGTEVLSTADQASTWDTNRQEWKIRFGTAFAFLAKTCLASSIAIAYTQHIWASCRKKAYSISGLDALFSATSDVFAFASLDLTLRAKIGAVLAAFVWMLPLSALITPATLTVVSVGTSNNESGQVPQVDFRTGPSSGSPVLDAQSDSPYSWNNMPSPLLTRTSFAAASSMSILSMSPGTPNSTYVLNFNGPSLRCEEPNSKLLGLIDEVVEAVAEKVGGNAGGDSLYTAFTPTIFTYYNFTDMVPDFGSFVDDCIIGGSTCAFIPGNVTTASPINGTDNFGRSDPLIVSLNQTRYTCALKNTSYSVRFRSSTQQTTLELLSFQWEDTDPSLDLTYRSVGMAIAKILTGTYYLLATHEGGYQSVTMISLNSARTSIGSTSLMGLVNAVLDPRTYGQSNYIKLPSADLALTRNKTLGELVEELSRNVTLSLFSSTRFISNVSAVTNITYDSQINVYSYNAHNLWTAYGAAILVTLFSIVVGLVALYSNGVSYRTSFSTIVATTRNDQLDEIMVGSSLGADPMRRDVMQTRLKFGVCSKDPNETIQGANGAMSNERVGFGLETQIRPLENKQCYH